MIIRIYTGPCEVEPAAAEIAEWLPHPNCSVDAGTEHVYVHGLTSVADLRLALTDSWAYCYVRPSNGWGVDTLPGGDS